MEIKQCELTDGDQSYDIEWLTAEELTAVNQEAQETTEGEMWWQEVAWSDGDADYFQAVYTSQY